jgi:hypothetical protein
MQGFPREGYEPLPPNSPKHFYCEEVENHSNVGSVATHLLTNPERALVTVEEYSTLPINLASQVPLEPLLLRLDSSGNVIEEYYPCLSSRPYTETRMESTPPNFNDEYTTPVSFTGIVNPQQTLVYSIWRTPSERDLYEKFKIAANHYAFC